VNRAPFHSICSYRAHPKVLIHLSNIRFSPKI
jgi:hypothetical protein